MRPHRRLMDPSTLEMLVMLRFNRDLWDERDVDTVIARNYDVTRRDSDTPASTSHQHFDAVYRAFTARSPSLF